MCTSIMCTIMCTNMCTNMCTIMYVQVLHRQRGDDSAGGHIRLPDECDHCAERRYLHSEVCIIYWYNKYLCKCVYMYSILIYSFANVIVKSYFLKLWCCKRTTSAMLSFLQFVVENINYFHIIVCLFPKVPDWCDGYCVEKLIWQIMFLVIKFFSVIMLEI